MATSEPVSVLFVCLGNICRSTMAEGIFRSMIAQGPYQSKIAKVDSCGTAAYHSGSPPDHRTMDTLRENGITDYKHRARKVTVNDFKNFDYIFAMDRDNLDDLQALSRRTEGKAQVMLFGEFAAAGGKAGEGAEEIEDPYYGGNEGFKVAFEQCRRFSGNFLREVFPGVEG
ncbi:phosphotyrosine phosphatase protein [Rutstroemia sp. NJR-2017a WRK4]|nr:phosphotyrosine phosphatase protein [Rutstroemia sp. NJR-2017a WRK4]